GHVGHRDAGLPAVGIGHPRALGDVLETVVALVKVALVEPHVRRAVEDRHPVIVDVAHRHATAVVEVQVLEDVEGGVVGEPVGERDAGALLGEALEQLRLPGAAAARDPQRGREEQSGPCPHVHDSIPVTGWDFVMYIATSHTSKHWRTPMMWLSPRSLPPL